MMAEHGDLGLLVLYFTTGVVANMHCASCESTGIEAEGETRRRRVVAYAVRRTCTEGAMSSYLPLWLGRATDKAVAVLSTK